MSGLGALGVVAALCVIAWLIAIRNAAREAEAEAERRHAQKNSEVKDEQLVQASKPRLSPVELAKRMRNGQL